MDCKNLLIMVQYQIVTFSVRALTKKDDKDKVGEESSDVNHLKFGFIDIKG